jgi:hypothetical protein
MATSSHRRKLLAASLGIATMTFGCGTDTDSPKSSGNLMAADCGPTCNEPDSGTRDTGALDSGVASDASDSGASATDADATTDASDGD